MRNAFLATILAVIFFISGCGLDLDLEKWGSDHSAPSDTSLEYCNADLISDARKVERAIDDVRRQKQSGSHSDYLLALERKEDACDAFSFKYPYSTRCVERVSERYFSASNVAASCSST